MSVERYNARTVEIRWQQVWNAQKAFAAWSPGPDAGNGTPVGSPGPSRGCNGGLRADGLHINDLRRCTMADVAIRYKHACSDATQHPPRRDAACGPPAESAAGAVLQSLALSFDWRGELAICDAGRRAPEKSNTSRCPQAALQARSRSVGEPLDVDPGEIIDTYGADATRWFVLSDSPLDRDAAWSDTGLRGAWRFVQRLWRIVNSAAKFSQGAPTSRPSFSAPAVALRRTAHQTLAQVSRNIEQQRFNVCVAHIYAFARTLEAVVAESSGPASPDLKFAAREAAEMMVQLFHPMMPHLAEECWAALGHDGLLASEAWPVLQADLLVADAVTLPVYVNGRKRAHVTVARDARNGDIEVFALALNAVRRALDGKTPRKVIIVPQRIINVVA
jgi:leucyl-tRNA synthetase